MLMIMEFFQGGGGLSWAILRVAELVRGLTQRVLEVFTDVSGPWWAQLEAPLFPCGPRASHMVSPAEQPGSMHHS